MQVRMQHAVADRHNQLFASQDLGDVLRQRRAGLTTRVDALDSVRLLKAAAQQLADEIAATAHVEPLSLDLDGIVIDGPNEIKIDVTHDPLFARSITGRPVLAPGVEVTFCVRFTGDPALFRLQPSTTKLVLMRADVVGDELRFTRSTTGESGAGLARDFNNEIEVVADVVGYSRVDVEAHNASLRGAALQLIERRRQHLTTNEALVQSLGFPVRRRTNAPTTYVASTPRRPLPAATQRSSAAGSADPALADEEYEHVLKVCTSMTLVMERSPAAFRTLSEPDIRTHFLIQLNGQYAGQATGETFNGDGKTDILVRVGDRNIFIAECKFWGGAGSLTAAIDQLLGYTVWRDAKAALFVFSRNKEFTEVVRQIEPVVRAHPKFKRATAWRHETGFRGLFAHRDDPERELILSVIAFNIPT